MADLRVALQVRGSARRRFLRECCDHLNHAADERGPAAAVSAFGPAAEIAAAFDAEVAARRGVRATCITVAGVVATGGSTLALIQASSADATAPALWVIAFFISAQVAAVAAGLAIVQALVLRHGTMASADVALLARRDACALVAAGLAMFSAGAAVPGRGSAVVLLAGPLVVGVAAVSVLRTRSLARRLDGTGPWVVRPPLDDVSRATGVSIRVLAPRRLLLITTPVAAAAAFTRDVVEHAQLSQALATAGIEAVAVVACFLLLGPALGLWRPSVPRATRSATSSG